MKSDESSIEFDMFEDVRLKLTHILGLEGRDPVEAERIAFYVVQGVREVPKLLAVLARDDAPAERVRELLAAVLENSSQLDRARAILEGQNDPIVH